MDQYSLAGCMLAMPYSYNIFHGRQHGTAHLEAFSVILNGRLTWAPWWLGKVGALRSWEIGSFLVGLSTAVSQCTFSPHLIPLSSASLQGVGPGSPLQNAGNTFNDELQYSFSDHHTVPPELELRATYNLDMAGFSFRHDAILRTHLGFFFSFSSNSPTRLSNRYRKLPPHQYFS